MIEITRNPISPEAVVNRVKTNGSGCVVTYVGLIRKHSQGKEVLSVEYHDSKGTAHASLQKIADELKQKWPLENVGICHRVDKLRVGEINLVVAIAAAHRQEGLAACQYAIDLFKKTMPTQKIETYLDGTTMTEG